MLLAVVGVARMLGLDAESALRRATTRFAARAEGTLALATERGLDPADLSDEELLALYAEAKGRAHDLGRARTDRRDGALGGRRRPPRGSSRGASARRSSPTTFPGRYDCNFLRVERPVGAATPAELAAEADRLQAASVIARCGRERHDEGARLAAGFRELGYIVRAARVHGAANRAVEPDRRWPCGR